MFANFCLLWGGEHLLNRVSLSMGQALESWKTYVERRAYKESRDAMALDFFAVTSLRFYLLRWQEQCRQSEEALAKKLSVAVHLAEVRRPTVREA